MNENKIMDKINKNLKIIDNLLMENGFYKYISKVVNIEDGISQLYDNLKQLQQENARLKDKMKDIEKILKSNHDVEHIYCALSQYLGLFDYELDLKDYLKEN